VSYFTDINDKNILDWKYEGNNDIIEVVDSIRQKAYGTTELTRTTYKIINYKKQYVSDTSFTIPYDSYDSVQTEATIYIPGSYSFEIKNLGWINCDRFLEIENKTELTIELVDFSQPTGFIVFDSLNSAISLFFDSGKTTIEGLPSHSRVDLIILDKIGENVFWFRKQLITGETKTVKVKTEKIKVDDLRLELDKIGYN
jgi:hypothetical protein